MLYHNFIVTIHIINIIIITKQIFVNKHYKNVNKNRENIPHFMDVNKPLDLKRSHISYHYNPCVSSLNHL